MIDVNNFFKGAAIVKSMQNQFIQFEIMQSTV